MRVPLTRICCNAIAELVNAVCITPNHMHAISATTVKIRRLDDRPNCSWCDPVFVRRLSITRGLRRKQLSRYNGADGTTSSAVLDTRGGSTERKVLTSVSLPLIPVLIEARWTVQPRRGYSCENVRELFVCRRLANHFYSLCLTLRDVCDLSVNCISGEVLSCIVTLTRETMFTSPSSFRGRGWVLCHVIVKTRRKCKLSC